MEVIRPKKDIVELFGYAPNDTTPECRTLWKLGACPFVNNDCTKMNHTNGIVYGTCSVTSPYGDCIICPNRLYYDHFATLKNVAKDAFGNKPFYTKEEFIERRNDHGNFIVALGHNSGHEIQIPNRIVDKSATGRTGSMSMDWILAEIDDLQLKSYTGIEVQSIDITGNYRDTWYAYKNLMNKGNADSVTIPESAHGLNWANVHKRLIPQIIRKSIVYSNSKYVNSGLYFIVPEIVYKKFEEVIGDDIPLAAHKAPNVITVHTYELEDTVQEGNMRSIRMVRNLRFTIENFSQRFIASPTLPLATSLDEAIKKSLGIS